jgi:hypothetical protein
MSVDYLQQFYLGSKVEFMEDVRGNNPIKGGGERFCPVAQQVSLEELDLGQLRFRLRQHFGGEIYSPHWATQVDKTGCQVACANPEVQDAHPGFYMGELDNTIQNLFITGEGKGIPVGGDGSVVAFCPLIE